MFASRANSWISPVTEKDRVLKLTKTTKKLPTLGTKAELLVRLENQKKNQTKTPRIKRV